MPRVLTVIGVLFLVSGAWAAVDMLAALLQGRILVNVVVVQALIGWLLLTRQPAGQLWAIRWCWLVLLFLVFFGITLLLNDPFFRVWGQEISPEGKAYLSWVLIGTFIITLWTLRYLARPETYASYGQSAPSMINRTAYTQRILSSILLAVILLYNSTQYLYVLINQEVVLRISGPVGTSFEGFCSYKVTSFSLLLLGNQVSQQRNVAIDIAGTITHTDTPEERRFNGTRGECIVHTIPSRTVSLSIVQADGSVVLQDGGRSADSARVAFGGRK